VEAINTVELRPVPLPDLSRTDRPVREALQTLRSELAGLVESPLPPEDKQAPIELAAAFGELGQIYLAHRLYLAAEACLLNAQMLTPEEFRWPYYLGYLYQQDTHLERSANAFQQALRIRPDYGPAKLRLAEVSLALDRLDKAGELFEQTADEDGLRAASLFGLGRVALARRQFEQARDLLTRALDAQPEASKIHYPLAMAYRGLGDTEQAKAQLAQFGDGEPQIKDALVKQLQSMLAGARTQLHQAIEALRAGHYQDAAKGFAKALEYEPDNVNARVTLARALYLGGDRNGAQQQLEAALGRQPNHALGNFLLGVLVDEAGDTTLALKHYRATLVDEPQHSGAHAYLANALLGQRQYSEALPHYREAVELEPKNVWARLLEAIAMLRTGAAHSRVRDRLEAALAENPDQPVLAYALARLLAASPDAEVRDGARALRLAQPLVDKFNAPENLATLAMAQAELGRFEEAIATQEAALSAAWTLGRFDQSAALQKDLEGYRKGEPCRQPWTEQDPIFRPPPTLAYAPFRHYPTQAAY
jgi:tetratricopeptide (TPR) repeat protein